MKPEFYSNNYYHIFNRANSNHDLLFKNEENYIYFLKKYRFYCDSIFETIAYCLMPNHFHFLVRVKNVSKEDLTGFKNLSGLVSKRVSNLCNSYTKSFNKKYERRGSLFERPFKRILVDNQKYFTTLVRYIHRNPLHHNVVTDLRNWQFSSYWDYADLRKGKLPKKDLVFTEFNSVQEFVKFTQINFIEKELEKYLIE